MATVNKDFKIKSGLIVEGTTATVNGYDILTKKPADDQYIIDLIGGETLVKSVSNEFDVSVAGELSIDRATVDAYYDAAGDAADAEQAAKSYADGLASNYDPAGSAQGAYDNAVIYVNDEITTALGTAQGYANTAEDNANSYTNTAITNLDLSNTYDAKGSAATAEQNAKDYADNLIDDASNLSTEVWSAYKTSTEIGLAQAAAEQHADEAVAALVDSAPALLDTLNELAAAINDDANFASTIGTSIGEKVAKAGDTMTGALTLSGAPTTSLHAATKAYVDSAESNAISTAAADATTKADAAEDAAIAAAALDATAKADAAEDAAIAAAALDATDKANAAQSAAIAHADGLKTFDIAEDQNLYFTDSRAKTSAAELLTGATLSNITITGSGSGLTITAENGVADSDTDDLAEGSTNLYFQDSRALGAISGSNIQPESIDITWVRREEATWTNVPTASTATVHSFGTNKGSVKYLVRVISGPNSHVTELLVTTDSNNNVALVEYGTIYTSLSPLATATVEWDGQSEYNLKVTTAQNGSEVLVAATMLAYND
jgi:hypothetical protein